MPYIAIKSFPKDKAIKEAMAEKINEAFLEIWGCPQEAITISFEEVALENWDDEVVKPEIETNIEKMMILDGKKSY